MSLSEFSLIARFFQRDILPAPNDATGIGDDAALIPSLQTGHCVVCTDMLVAGRHFLHDDCPFDIAWKALAVNLSDLAAMGATPRHCLLSLALPHTKERWLARFAEGFFDCADTFGIRLIGGDTTAGPLTISITAMGHVESPALLRSWAQPGDDIWVSGKIGLAACGLAFRTKVYQASGDFETDCIKALYRPKPRLKLGQQIASIAHAAIDISDGLLSDLGHILTASNVGATVCLDALLEREPRFSQLPQDMAFQAICHGGDDYELCFTAPKNVSDQLLEISKTLDIPLTNIGTITAETGLTLYHQNQPVTVEGHGFDHFIDSDASTCLTGRSQTKK